MFQEIPGEFDYLREKYGEKLNDLLIVDFSDITDDEEEKSEILDYCSYICEKFKEIYEKYEIERIPYLKIINPIYNIYKKILDKLRNLDAEKLKIIEEAMLLCNSQAESIISNITEKTKFSHVSFADYIISLNKILDYVTQLETVTRLPIKSEIAARLPAVDTFNDTRKPPAVSVWGNA